MTQSDAYRTAYNAGKMADSTIWARASELMADSKVSARVKELREQLSHKKLWTREMSIKALIKAYKVAEDSGQSSAMTSAVKELNAMHGYNEPTKLDLSSSDGSMTPKIDVIRIIAGNGNT